jgi:flagellar biosynthesis/type III secretory pathway M-ring protein FliF/YscJ
MLQGNYQVVLGLGAFFILLGIVFILWNRREKNRYYNSILLTRRDIQETITREHERFWLQAWKIGGWISVIVGSVLLIIGVILWRIAP